MAKPIYSLQVIEFSELNQDGSLPIKGIAIHAKEWTEYGITIEPEQLASIKKPDYVPIIWQHSVEKPQNVIGLLDEINFNSATKALHYKGRIMDKDVQQMIKDGRVKFVSIGFKAVPTCSICQRKLSDSECSHIIGRNYDNMLCRALARNMEFRELSITPFPIDKEASIEIAEFAQCITGICKKKNDLYIDLSTKSIMSMEPKQLIELSEEELKQHPFVAELAEQNQTLAEKLGKLEDEQKATKSELDALKTKEAEREQKRLKEFAEKTADLLKKAGMPAKPVEELIKFGEDKMMFIQEIANSKLVSAEGGAQGLNVELTDDQTKRAKVEALKKKLQFR